MSSTYLHYTASSSLPSDYAILSRYNSRNANSGVTDDDESRDDLSDSDLLTVPTSLNRRRSVPSSFASGKPKVHPTMAALPVPRATENTPLLEQHVPRIVEESEPYEPLTGSRTSYGKETWIMAKYTFPGACIYYFF